MISFEDLRAFWWKQTWKGSTLVLQDVDLGWTGLSPSLAALDSTE